MAVAEEAEAKGSCKSQCFEKTPQRSPPPLASAFFAWYGGTKRKWIIFADPLY